MTVNRVLGIDPGSRVMGWGVIEEISGVAKLVDCGAIRATDKDFARRMGVIFKELNAIVQLHKPTVAAVENVFTAQNPASALKLGQARGVALAACAANDIEVFSYEPTKIKQTIVGGGRAAKEQVAFMVAQILGVKKPSWALDTSDALAAAVCHLNTSRYSRYL
ncbi:crossover junction endodeoxyribonuclease RuvC [Halodesulfovibrio marinisediminis]|uniref:Crossover junction endodeoxyribonuclease RuvC n=1 Tax=Halodesulfovibrio marinisediminis DSM 17456 TaxID=1121457 RepID=A0A1N6DD67_9BACT|nr:crossover junction endodeoxyribonuclease RuvC [Halodesulfovibrio marinisediminis]SIN68750.1 Holliday junction endonuclease RuvC [Halodesulfovibrio marinisediminis DSM 17456]